MNDAMNADLVIRCAVAGDAPAIAGLVNVAYEVERSFVQGDRTSAAEVRSLMRTDTFLVGHTADGRLAATVHVALDGARGSFGMLAVDPAGQRQGRGRAMIEAAEAHARRLGAGVMEIRVVNLRGDLLPRYERLGYVATGTDAYVHRPVTRPCHFVVMRKALR